MPDLIFDNIIFARETRFERVDRNKLWAARRRATCYRKGDVKAYSLSVAVLLQCQLQIFLFLLMRRVRRHSANQPLQAALKVTKSRPRKLIERYLEQSTNTEVENNT